MRMKIFTVVAVVLGLGVGFFIRDAETPQIPLKAQDNNSASSYGFEKLTDELDSFSASLKSFQQENQEQLSKTLAEQQNITRAIKDIENRLKSIEIEKAAMMERRAEFEGDDPVFNDEILSSSGSAMEIGEVDIRNWIDDSISLNYVNVESSQEALSEVMESLDNLPGVNVETMQCGEGFCRAMFAQENGEIPDISEIVGLPPFTGSGFTKPGEDGTVTVYFTEAGISMEDLKERLIADRTN